MHVTCEKCNTTYILDSDLVKDSGTKVRCANCKHVFVVYKKERSQMKSDTLYKTENTEDIVDNGSDFEQVVDGDLGYWQEKLSQIINHRIDFDIFSEEEQYPQNPATVKSQTEVNYGLYKPYDELKEDENSIVSTDEGNKENYYEDESLTTSLKNDEKEFLGLGTGIGERHTLDDTDDFHTEDNFEDNSEDLDSDLPDKYLVTVHGVADDN